MPTTAARTKPRYRTVADVQERLGHIPEWRILMFPTPGTATVLDLLDGSITGYCGHELVDGILVEKTMGFRDDDVGTQLFGFLAHTWTFTTRVRFRVPKA